MTIKRIIPAAVMIIVSIICSCSRNESKSEIVIAAPKSPAALAALQLQDSNMMLNNSEIRVELYPSMEAMITLAQSETVDFILLPVNTAAVLHNKGFRIKMMNVFQWGGLYLSTTDPECREWKDLKGKTLYVPSKGSVPDLATQLFLDKHNLITGTDLDIVYSNHNEIAQLLSAGKISYAVDVQPFVTLHRTKLKDYFIVSEYSDEWTESAGGDIRMPGFCMAATNSDIIPDASAMNRMNELFAASLEKLLASPEKAGKLAEKYMNANAGIITAAFGSFGMDFTAAAEAKYDIDKYYSVLYEMKPGLVGGALPKEDMFHDSGN